MRGPESTIKKKNSKPGSKPGTNERGDKMWVHPKHKATYRGRYNRTKKGLERVFELVNSKTGRVISFESWQMAKRQGWKKS
jgi:ABC-type tungstate transport system permease subunit